MPEFIRVKPLITCAAILLSAVFGSSKASADEMGKLTIMAVEFDQTIVDRRIEKAARNIPVYLREWVDITKHTTPKIVGNTVTVKIGDPEEFDTAHMVMTVLVRNARGTGPQGRFQTFTLDADREAGRFTLRITKAFSLNATHEQAKRAARLVHCRLSDFTDAEVVITDEIKVAIWAADVDLQVSTHSHGCGTSTISIHAIETELHKSDVASVEVFSNQDILPDTKDADKFWLVDAIPIVSSEEFSSIIPDEHFSEESVLSAIMNPAGARKFREWTRKNIGNRMAMVLDGEVFSPPVIREPILSGSITMFTGLMHDENERLAAQLDRTAGNIRFKEIEVCEKTRAEALRDLSCAKISP